MEPETYRASPILGPVIGGMLGVIYLVMYFGIPLIASDMPDGFGVGGAVAFIVSWIAVTAIAALIGMRVVLRVNEYGIESRGRKLAWSDIASIERENRTVVTQGYNSASGITTRRTQHDLVIFHPKAENAPTVEINAALMKSGADVLAEKMRRYLASYGAPA